MVGTKTYILLYLYYRYFVLLTTFPRNTSTVLFYRDLDCFLCIVLVLVLPRRRGAWTPPGLHTAREPRRRTARMPVLRHPLPDEAPLI